MAERRPARGAAVAPSSQDLPAGQQRAFAEEPPLFITYLRRELRRRTRQAARAQRTGVMANGRLTIREDTRNPAG